ncbi:MAG TPA: sigma factor-like helix-turn-helix DNA-binding protein, partial [Solirubrobacterales bacterium]|nr:sigma factor-like helix-turn-helix DNA-binding protein [Solirubrobacterales bacterium]
LVALEAPAAEDGEAAAAGNEFRAHLLAGIDALPEKVRIVLVLAGIEGHGMREIATLLELPEGTVKSRLHLARRRLLECLR